MAPVMEKWCNQNKDNHNNSNKLINRGNNQIVDKLMRKKIKIT